MCMIVKKEVYVETVHFTYTQHEQRCVYFSKGDVSPEFQQQINILCIFCHFP